MLRLTDEPQYGGAIMSAGQPFGGVSIDPNTGNPTSRTTPEHTLKRIYADGTSVVVVGTVGGEEVSSMIPRTEAIHRARALSDMARKAKYSDEHDHLMNMVEQFVVAINKSKENEGGQYKSIHVSMFQTGQKQRAAQE